MNSAFPAVKLYTGVTVHCIQSEFKFYSDGLHSTAIRNFTSGSTISAEPIVWFMLRSPGPESQYSEYLS